MDEFDTDEFDIESDLARAEMELSVRVERRRYDKPVTVVEGFDASVVDLSDVASTLKRRLGAGGTADESTGTVEVQGDHADRVPAILEEMGFVVS